MVGHALGHYKIEEQLGAGGMGVVYRATDSQLGRQVAIKVLPEKFASAPELLARFEREARILASLNHPSIAAIYGLEVSQDVRYLVLELVPGETLAKRVMRGPLEIREAMTVCQQIAEALEAAHAKGIMHRDLKPANVNVTPQGKVKVLDFGLAKVFQAEVADSDLSQSPTVRTDGTRAGIILGTAAYMSPEQARGKPLDKRSDIWSFGCVLYELLAGRKAFLGETITDCMAAVLGKEPDWDALPAETPAPVSVLLRRCLRKDASIRLRDIGDARIELEDALAVQPQESLAYKQNSIPRRTAISALLGAAAGAVATGVFAVSRYRRAVPRNPTRFSIALPEGEFRASFNRRVAISPDGTYLAFNAVVSGADAFYIRFLNELESKRLKDVSGAAGAFFSPDNRWVGFILSANMAIGIRKLALSGGAPVTVCAADNFLGGTWADGDTIYFVPELPGGIVAVPAAGGAPKEIVKIDFAKGERQHRYPCALPGGKAVMFTTATADTPTFDEARIVAFSLETGRKKVLERRQRISGRAHINRANDATPMKREQ